jgi:hypothetical protein
VWGGLFVTPVVITPGCDGLEDGGDGAGGGKVLGRLGEVGEAAVVGEAEAEAGFGEYGVGEDGTVGGSGIQGLEDAAVEEDGEGGVEEDGEGAGGLFEEEAVGVDLGGTAAEGDDGGGHGEGGGQGGGLEAAEGGLAEAGEEVGDGGVGALFEVVVEIEESPAEVLGEGAAYGGFACAHEAGEDDASCGRGEGEGGGGDLDGVGLDVGWHGSFLFICR